MPRRPRPTQVLQWRYADAGMPEDVNEWRTASGRFAIHVLRGLHKHGLEAIAPYEFRLVRDATVEMPDKESPDAW